MKMKKVSYDLYQKVRRLSQEGLHSAEIAKKVRLDEFRILEILTTNYSSVNNESKIDKNLGSNLDLEVISPRNSKIIELRKSGMTLGEIGKEVNVTRERVRQILKKYAPEIISHDIHEQREENELKAFNERNFEIHEIITHKWDAYKHLKFEDLATNFSVPVWRIRRCLSRIQYVYIQANEDRKMEQNWTDEDCLQSLRNAATFSFPITVTKYRKLLEEGEIIGPTPPLFWQRFGSWVQACELAGVEYGEAVREYDRTWNDTELILFARKFMHSRSDGKWSIEKYEEWRRSTDVEGPSVGLLRLRLGSWTEIRVLALELTAPEFDMQKFMELRSNDK